MLTSAHFEASLFYSEPPFRNGGLTECQQYNNYTFMVTQHMAAMVGRPDAPGLRHELRASSAGGEVKQTQLVVPRRTRAQKCAEASSRHVSPRLS